MISARSRSAERPPRPLTTQTGRAEAELSLSRARQAFEDIEFSPNILRDVSTVDTSRTVLGGQVALPFGIAPTGFTRMMQAEGEVAGAGAAGGFETLLVTVDVPVAGARLRDTRNGMTIPPTLTPKTVINALPRPAWWINFLTTEPLAFASLDRWSGNVAQLIDSMFDPTVTFDDLSWIKDQWPGKLVVKGVQNLDDAKKLASMGVDAILLSNHGGRQLDRAPIPFHLMPKVVREVGKDTEVHLDTGIMSGADIVAAVALGARFTLVGRAYLYGLMAGGREGVDRAIEILSSQITRTMRLLGVNSLDDLDPRHVTQLQRLIPRG